MNEHWYELKSAMTRLEDCANPDLGGRTIINAREAQALLDEIWQLRIGKNHSAEAVRNGWPAGSIPAAPAQEGEQFEDREGHVWTWTNFFRLRISGTVEDKLVREDGDELVILSWREAWEAHGPLWPIGSAAERYQTVLRVRLVVNGRMGVAQEAVDDEYWDRLGDNFHTSVKNDLLRRFGEHVVRQLDPPVSVQRAPRWIREHQAEERNGFVAFQQGQRDAEA
jgi:hypothetical protein